MTQLIFLIPCYYANKASLTSSNDTQAISAASFACTFCATAIAIWHIQEQTQQGSASAINDHNLHALHTTLIVPLLYNNSSLGKRPSDRPGHYATLSQQNMIFLH